MSFLLLIRQAEADPVKADEFLFSNYNLEKLKTVNDRYGYTCDYFNADDLSEADIKSIRLKLAEFRADVLLTDSLLFKDERSMVVFDMDSTLIRQEVIDELARKYGVYDQVSAVTREAMEGNLDFNESLKRRCSHLAGAAAGIFDELYTELRLNDGVPELLKALNESGVVTCVFSGGFDRILNRFGSEFGFNHFVSNHLEETDGRLTGNIIGEIVNREKKRDLLLAIRSSEGIRPEQCIAVGDGANDSLMLAAAGTGIGFHAKDGLKKLIVNWIDFAPMTSLLFLYHD